MWFFEWLPKKKRGKDHRSFGDKGEEVEEEKGDEQEEKGKYEEGEEKEIDEKEEENEEEAFL